MMFPFFRTKVAEAGRSISADNLVKLQGVHDTMTEMGAVCGAHESSVLGVSEASLAMTDSFDSLRGHLRDALMKHLNVSNTYDSSGPWIMDIFPTSVVYSFGGVTQRLQYTAEYTKGGNNPTITLKGSPKVTHVAYVDSSSQESMRVFVTPSDRMEENWESFKALGKGKETVIITAEMVVSESVQFFPVGDTPEQVEVSVQEARGSKTTIPVAIISPGWGSSAYYSKKMIQNSGPSAFVKGTQMFINHQTDIEESLRPEGDLNQLAAVLTKDAYWNDNGPKGAALYSEAYLFSDHSDKILEKGPYIGCSIKAAIKAHEGTVEGRSGRIADAFVRGFSVDFVTKAGRGGAPIVAATESARGSAPTQAKESSMTQEETARLDALTTENTSLKGSIRALQAQQEVVLASGTVSGILKESGITVPFSLIQRVCSTPVMKEGKVCLDWAKAVAAELAETAGGQGRVTGLGVVNTRTQEAQKKVDDAFTESLKKLGIPEAGLAVANY